MLRYSKFHLGAILIQENFPQYILLTTTQEHLSEIGRVIEEVLDRQQHDAFGHFNKQVQKTKSTDNR
jgi:uncharacterized protein YbgA (DUF1722 family)